MFTGIVQEIGVVVRVERIRGLIRLTVQAPKTASSVQVLESVAVNGVCLSVVLRQRGRMTFEVIPKTEYLTNLDRLRVADHVNLEPSLSLSDRLSGHFVLGHVDGIGTVISRRGLSGETVLVIRTSPSLMRFMVSRGSVTIDGVSLTVGEKQSRSTFAVHLIPETLRRTTLAERRVGNRINIEVDYLAKLMATHAFQNPA